MEGKGHQRRRFPPPQRRPPPEQLSEQTQNLAPDLLLQNLGLYLQNNPLLNQANNPYFIQNPNFSVQNPSFPIHNHIPYQNAYPVVTHNSNFPNQLLNPCSSFTNDVNPKISLQNKQPQQQRPWNPKFPVQAKSETRSDRKEMLETIEAAVASARRELVTAGENVSVWKVSQSVLVKLQVDSWDSLGFQIQEVPSLHHLILTEGKINTFIHCYVAVQRITSLFDLQAAICKNEGIETFEDLELGPFLQHPLVVHYFSVIKGMVRVYKITTEEIMLYLSEFSDARNRKNVKIEEFLDFVAKKCRVSSWQELGVRVQSLGMYIALLREAYISKDLVTKKYMDTVKDKGRNPRKKRPLFSLEKQQLDDRFSALTERVTSFATVSKDFPGKHIRFMSSSSDEGDDAIDSSDSEEKGQANHKGNDHEFTSLKSRSGDKVSGCPYPSVAEEMKRLGLKGEINECSSPVAHKLSSSQKGKHLKKKRKINSQCQGEVTEKSSVFKPEVTRTEEIPDQINDLSLVDDSIRMFLTTWKEACRECRAPWEVFEKMIDKMSCRQRKQLRSAFIAYPLAGLLNVAVMSIKNGTWDSMYDKFQLMGDLGLGNPHADEHQQYESIDVEPVEKHVSLLNNELLKPGPCVDAEDIVRKASEYFAESGQLSSEDSLLDNILRFTEQLNHCEVWLGQQFSVEEFKLLGHGDFFSFVGKHVSLIPKELLECVTDEVQVPPSLEACMLQEQLFVLLSQASSNLQGDDGSTKEKISELLIRQFPYISFKLNGSIRVEQLSDWMQNRSNISSNCVMFSATLVGTRKYGNSAHCNESDLSDSSALLSDLGQMGGKLGSATSRDAIEVLLRAPFLSDLNSWTHWDLLYAPSRGPLLQWLLTEVNSKDFLSLLTQDGKIIRIDHSASEDLFFEAILLESPFQIALQFLSLLALHGGQRHFPLSFLKCQARQAFEVIMGNSVCNVGMNDGQRISNKSKGMSGVNGAVAVVMRIFIDCLGFLPSEFRSFAAEILLSGLQFVVKNVASAVLLHCKGIEERLMIHDVGLSLGIIEWIHDHHVLCSSANGDSLMSTRSSFFISVDPDAKEVCCIQNPADNVPLSAEKAEKHKIFSDVSEIATCPTVDGPDKVMLECSIGEDTEEVKEAALIIESIRREEFGLDPTMSDVERELLKKQHARLGRALHCLSEELYSQDSHFLLELVQNADDNVYPDNVEPTLTFVLQHTGIIVLNNERGFTAQNIKALCDVGNSTKKGSSSGYIGQKGIGFKSVFRVTDAPEIHSNGFHFKFDITEGQIGFVLPTIVPPCDVDMFKQLASEGDITKIDNGLNTCIVLPFKSKLREGSAMSSTLSMFSDLHPSLLLFLHRLECIKLRNMVNDTLIVMRKNTLGDGIVRVSHGEEKMTWFVVSNKLHPKVIRPNVQMTEISIALTLKEIGNGDYEPFLDQQPVFAFLPLRKYGLKFILQADFVLPSSREEVDGDSPWNQWLLSEFPGLFVAALKSFCALPCFQINSARAVTFYMSFVPLMGEVHGFFSGLPHMIISKLRQSNCMLEEGCKDKWVPPCKVFRGWNEEARVLLPESLLHEHLGLGFLNRDISLSDSLARALGIEEYGPKILVQFISSLGRTRDGIKSMGLGWLVTCLSELYNMFHSYALQLRNSGLEQDIMNSLRRVPFIPLSDGSYSSLDEGTIWFNSDSVIASSGTEMGHDVFPHLYGTLRIVSPSLFFEASSDATLIHNCTKILQMIGVQKLSAHELIRTHILPSICHKLKDEDHLLMIEYMAFVMLHLQSNCVDCLVDNEHVISELRSKAFILTNHGYKRLAEVSIHFSKELGNSVDVNKLMHSLDYKWHEVDKAYLKHSITASMSCGWMKWREFLQKLGVSDFVRVLMVEKSMADLPSTVLNQMMCNKYLISSDLAVKDWESPELAQIISLLSKDGYQDRSKYLLEVLDVLWDDLFSDKVLGCCSSKCGGDNMFFRSSLMNSLTDSRWVASSLDKELHYPKDLFYDCDAVRSVLGCQAPYAVAKIKSSKLLSEIGFKTQVTVDDALMILKIWQRLESPFKASISHMSKLYAFIWKEMASSRKQLLDALCSESFIFVPHSSVKVHEDIVSGSFLSREEVYWHDSIGLLDCANSSIEPVNGIFSKTLSTVYPGLHDFFVKECGVNEASPFRHDLHILQQLSSSALPGNTCNVVFKVFLKWCDDLGSGVLNSDDMNYLKEQLLQPEFTILPATQDKWVSLHTSFGLVCWCDDDVLKKEFKHSDNIEFLYFGELTNNERELLQTKVSVLLQNLGIPTLSEVVFREPIYYGTADCGFKSSMVAWALPFAQRYMYHLLHDKYNQLKLSGLDELYRLKIVVVERLFYRNVIQRIDCASKKRFECMSLLQGNILYTTRESDCHSLFMELSRLLFDGHPELHLANFLCMITTMVESGSTEEQIESFILNSQKMTKLPEEETVWSLPLAPENDEVPVPLGINDPISSKSKKPGHSSWPPADWRTAPGFSYPRNCGIMTQAAIADKNGNLGKSDDIQESLVLEKADLTLTVINQDAVIEDNGVIDPDSSTLPLSLENQAGYLWSQPEPNMTSWGDPSNFVFESFCPNEYQSKSSGRDRLLSNTADNQQTRMTGRLGELVAFRFLSGKFGSRAINWVNEDGETGFPYDIVVGEGEEDREYFEVKASRFAKKDWFVISTREWQFAAEKGNSFSIAHVLLSGQNLVRIAIYKNPVKLCQQGKLQLAVMTPKFYQESAQ